MGFWDKFEYNTYWTFFFQLFASGLSQRGDSDEDGISGFLPADVLKELKRGLRLVSIQIT